MLAFLGGLAALIFVHELGHFLVARKVGVVVEKFSLGFGPKIFSFTQGGTEYLLCWIPLGGYVKMKGEEVGEESTDEKGSFSAAPVLDRLAIAFAGPLFNILFAIAIYYCVYLVGVPALSPIVGIVKEESPALAAGLQTGDRILAIGDEKILYWEQLQKIVHVSPGRSLDFQVERSSGNIVYLPITPVSEQITDLFGDKEDVGLIGITPLVRNIVYVKGGTPADRAGIQEGDILLSVGFTALFLLSLFSFPALLIHGLGYEVNYLVTLGLLVVTTFIMYFSPTPGASGISEGVFGSFFRDILSGNHLVLVTIAWRFLTIYLGMLIGLLVMQRELIKSHRSES
ncbi:RIP metalloprotease RseP [uncultured Marinobacter sp.]|nr:RIP metalloprotease RseP [uncultured Marinobacter sp.]